MSCSKAAGCARCKRDWWHTQPNGSSFLHAGDLDPAVIDRMDEALQFPLPSQAERRALIALYLDQYISAAGTAEGGAGSGAGGGFFARLSALLRGRKLSADRIQRAAGGY